MTAPPPAKAQPPIFHQALGDTQATGFQVEGDQATGSEDSLQISDWHVIPDTIPETISDTISETSVMPVTIPETISDTISETSLQTDTIPETPLHTSGAYTKIAGGKWVQTVKQSDNNDVRTTVDQVPVMGRSHNINVAGRLPQPGSQPRSAYTANMTYTGLGYLPTVQLYQQAQTGVWSHFRVSTNSWPSTWDGCNWARAQWWAGGEDDATDDSGWW